MNNQSYIISEMISLKPLHSRDSISIFLSSSFSIEKFLGDSQHSINYSSNVSSVFGDSALLFPADIYLPLSEIERFVVSPSCRTFWAFPFIHLKVRHVEPSPWLSLKCKISALK